MGYIYLAPTFGFFLVFIRLLQNLVVNFKGLFLKGGKMITFLLFGSFIVLLIINVPVGISLGIASMSAFAL